MPIPAAEVKEDDDAEKSESESASSDPLVQGIIKKFMRNAQYLNLRWDLVAFLMALFYLFAFFSCIFLLGEKHMWKWSMQYW